jgi:hypothetical protein
VSWLAISGLDLSAIAATVSDPKADRRDVGIQAPANDGSMRATRINRKHDLSVVSIPLSGSDAFAWENLLVGEGHHFAFDASLYSSKGLGPSSSSGATQVAGTPKYGAGVLRLAATTGTITYPAAANSSGGTPSWTVMVWRFETAVWHHYVVTSAGHKWFDGVRADGTSTTWLSVGSGNVTIANTGGASQDYDDLVVLPVAVLDAWPPLFFALGAAFSDLPYLTVAGSLVLEAATRKMIGKCTVAKVLRANPTGAAGAAAKDVTVLQIDLMEK